MPREPTSLVEIACDESGSEGEKLVGGNTAVFAHASVAIESDDAAACVADLRRRIRSPAVEYKANHLLRAKHRTTLLWLLGPTGPIYGSATVYLVEKSYFLVRSLVHRVDQRSAEEASLKAALTLHRDGPGLVGEDDWHTFLEWTNQLLWVRNGDQPRPTAAEYTDLLSRMRRSSAGHPAGDVLDGIWAHRALVVTARTPRDATHHGLDPLGPALARAIQAWTATGHRLVITHDEQSTITENLISELMRAWPALAAVRLVDSMADARVQVADFLAGVARRIAEDALGGAPDEELTDLLRPYVDPRSVWGDGTSWSALEPRNHGT